MSKEHRVDPQVQVGLLVDPGGFPLEVHLFEGNKAETTTLIPVLTAFQQRHAITEMVVVAHAGMLSAGNLNALEDAGFSFVVGSRITKAPYDLADHFERRGNYCTDGQVLESTRQMGSGKAARPRRVVYQWKFKREQHDNKAINAMIDRAERIADGRAPLKKARFLKVTGATKELDQATIDRARQLAGLKGYVTNLPTATMDGRAVIAAYHDLWRVEQSFRMTKGDLRARPVPPPTRGHRGPPDRRVRSPGRRPPPAGLHRDQHQENVAAVSEQVITENPELNVLIPMSGIMRVEDWTDPQSFLTSAEQTITTNVLGPIRLIAAFIEQLQSRPQATIITVSSGLAFAPLQATPSYNASKAAIHMLSESIRLQLAGTSVQVLELEPPSVATDLLPGQRDSAIAMPLNEFISEVVDLIESQPDAKEIQVENVKFLRYGEARGDYDQVVAAINQHDPNGKQDDSRGVRPAPPSCPTGTLCPERSDRWPRYTTRR